MAPSPFPAIILSLVFLGLIAYEGQRQRKKPAPNSPNSEIGLHIMSRDEQYVALWVTSGYWGPVSRQSVDQSSFGNRRQEATANILQGYNYDYSGPDPPLFAMPDGVDESQNAPPLIGKESALCEEASSLQDAETNIRPQLSCPLELPTAFSDHIRHPLPSSPSSPLP